MSNSIRAVTALIFTVSALFGRAGNTARHCQDSSVPAITSAPAVPSSPANAASLTSPAMTGPLSLRSPILFDAGPFGKLALNGVLSGFGVWQRNPVRHDQGRRADISNGQIVLQKTTGVAQFYLQAGAYNLSSLGIAVSSTEDTVATFYGPLPLVYFKLAPTSSFSFLAGKISSLMGAEYTFSFENANIERGLLWNQSSSVSRGVQLNYSRAKLSGSLSWNDGFYSNRWNWLTGALTYVSSPVNSLEFTAGGNLGHTGYATTASPAYQNNSSIYNIIYTHNARAWMIEPYFQYTYLPTYLQIGVKRATSTQGEAIFGSYKLPHHMSLAGRLEFISSSGSLRDGSANLLYGPGSNAFSVTVTPSYQEKAFFARGEVSYVHAGSAIAGEAFGRYGNNASQMRGVVEAGFLF